MAVAAAAAAPALGADLALAVRGVVAQTPCRAARGKTFCLVTALMAMPPFSQVVPVGWVVAVAAAEETAWLRRRVVSLAWVVVVVAA
jgi:hypothetical protein